jgi:DNA gyrase subunit B
MTIRDFGRGIPLGKDSNGEYVYNKVLSKLWSGGKMDNNDNSVGYQFSLGVNGIGAKATNFCSDIFQCTSFRDGREYFVEYKKGRLQGEIKDIKFDYENTGTITTWLPSKDVFRTGNNTDVEFVKTMLKQQAIVNKGLRFTFHNEIDGEDSEFYYENGVIDFIEEYGEGNNLTDIKYWSTESEGIDIVTKGEGSPMSKAGANEILEEVKTPYKIKCNVAFTFNNSKQLMNFYHNGSYLENGGTPEDFIKNGFIYSIDKYLNNNKLYEKADKKIKYDDLLDSLIIISDTYSTISLYTDQAKKKIDSDLMKRHMTEYLREQLAIYFTENPIEAKTICTTILNNGRANLKANEAKQNVRKKLQQLTSGKVKIDGLTDCDMRKSKVEDRWLLVVEGKSPKATVVEAYDNKCMGALGLRGRFISCLKKSVSEVLNNSPAYTFIKALGCGIEIPPEERKHFKEIKSFDEDNLRYGNIGILTDADCWGSGIRLALLTFIFKYLPTLLKENRVYIIISPRYEIKMKTGEMVYAYNEREKVDLMKTIKEDDIYNIGIVKGLGEINKEDFWDKVLCPEAREKTFIQVDYNNVDEVIGKYFEDYMGEDTQPRKEFVKQFITNVNLEDIN